jgi:hypothetical protein
MLDRLSGRETIGQYMNRRLFPGLFTVMLQYYKTGISRLTMKVRG